MLLFRIWYWILVGICWLIVEYWIFFWLLFICCWFSCVCLVCRCCLCSSRGCWCYWGGSLGCCRYLVVYWFWCVCSLVVFVIGFFFLGWWFWRWFVLFRWCCCCGMYWCWWCYWYCSCWWCCCWCGWIFFVCCRLGYGCSCYLGVGWCFGLVVYFSVGLVWLGGMLRLGWYIVGWVCWLDLVGCVWCCGLVLGCCFFVWRLGVISLCCSWLCLCIVCMVRIGGCWCFWSCSSLVLCVVCCCCWSVSLCLFVYWIVICFCLVFWFGFGWVCCWRCILVVLLLNYWIG